MAFLTLSLLYQFANDHGLTYLADLWFLITSTKLHCMLDGRKRPASYLCY